MKRTLRERVFVDTGAWIALAIVRDPLHLRARSEWEVLGQNRTRVVTSVPVLIETFTYLDRKGSREIAVRWRDALETIRDLEVLSCRRADIDKAWKFLESRDFHKLSLVDATSFVLMREAKIDKVFAFDKDFGIAGFDYVGG